MRNCSWRWIPRALLLALLAVTPAGCSLFKKRDGKGTAENGKPATKEEGKAAEQAFVRVVGEIVSVHAEEGFVLIRRHAQGGGFGKGNLIASVSPGGETASLVMTGERLGRFHAADVQEGTPTKGDMVFVRRLPEGSIAPSTLVPQAPSRSLEAPWMKNLPPPGL